MLGYSLRENEILVLQRDLLQRHRNFQRLVVAVADFVEHVCDTAPASALARGIVGSCRRGGPKPGRRKIVVRILGRALTNAPMLSTEPICSQRF